MAVAAQAAIGPREGSNPPVPSIAYAFFLPDSRGRRALWKEGVRMSSSLPSRPSLEWLRKTAKDRLADRRRTDPSTKLAAVQLELAREYGFSSWRQLVAHVKALPAPAAPAEPAVAAFLREVGAGHLDRVRERLDADPALVNALGPHPFWGGRPQALHVAIETTRREMVDLLLARGADVNGVNGQYDHWSPLMLAIDRDAAGVRDALIARGARIGLLEALMLRDDARVEQALRTGRLPDITPNGGSILAFARTPFAIDRLLALGAPADVKDRWGSTPIDAMSRSGAGGQALVQHMVSRGVPASPKEYARLGDRAALERLVAADPAVATEAGVLMGAVDFSHHDLVRWLLAHGADVNTRTEAQAHQTPLHAAAWNGDLAMVTLLVEAGADVDARDAQYDATPRGWAETAIEVTNNQRCAGVVAYLDALRPREPPRGE
jgi:ankyrin repeat protein